MELYKGSCGRFDVSDFEQKTPTSTSSAMPVSIATVSTGLPSIPGRPTNADDDGGSEEKAKIGDQENDELVAGLVRKFTAESTRFGLGDPFEAPSGSDLDPSSPSFNARRWTKAFYNATSDSSPRRTTGLSFSNLSVFGYGSETDYQATVINTVLKLGSKIPRIFGAHQRRIDILHDAEGVLRGMAFTHCIDQPTCTDLRILQPAKCCASLDLQDQGAPPF